MKRRSHKLKICSLRAANENWVVSFFFVVDFQLISRSITCIKDHKARIRLEIEIEIKMDWNLTNQKKENQSQV